MNNHHCDKGKLYKSINEEFQPILGKVFMQKEHSNDIYGLQYTTLSGFNGYKEKLFSLCKNHCDTFKDFVNVINELKKESVYLNLIIEKREI